MFHDDAPPDVDLARYPKMAESALTNCGRLGYAKEEHERATVVP